MEQIRGLTSAKRAEGERALVHEEKQGREAFAHTRDRGCLPSLLDSYLSLFLSPSLLDTRGFSVAGESVSLLHGVCVCVLS